MHSGLNLVGRLLLGKFLETRDKKPSILTCMTLPTRKSESHQKAWWAADQACKFLTSRRYETGDHCWKYNHDFDWENKK